MTGNDLAAWLAAHHMSQRAFTRAGGTSRVWTARLIAGGDAPIPDHVARTCFFLSLPAELRIALTSTYMPGVKL